MSKYICTGGAGFIGSHLVSALLKRGHEVVIIDDLSTGLKDNLPKYKKNESFTFAQLDITDWNTLTHAHSLFRQAAGVFHVAAFARIQPSILYPSHCMKINAEGTQNILEMMRLTGVENIVYSASSSCYGLKNKPPLIESMQPDCLTPYAASKLMGETLCKAWGRIYDIHNVSLRYFNVYGPRTPVHLGAYSPVIGRFFDQACKSIPLTVVGKGTQSRDFTHVDDVVHANIMAMMDLEKRKPACNGLTLNIGTGQSVNIFELAKQIQQIMASHRKNITIEHIPTRPGEATATLADISLAKQVLGWQPQITLAQGLEAMKIYYLDEVYKNP